MPTTISVSPLLSRMGDQAGRKHPPRDPGYERPLLFEQLRLIIRIIGPTLIIIFAIYMTYWLFL